MAMPFWLKSPHRSDCFKKRSFLLIPRQALWNVRQDLWTLSLWLMPLLRRGTTFGCWICPSQTRHSLLTQLTHCRWTPCWARLMWIWPRRTCMLSCRNSKTRCHGWGSTPGFVKPKSSGSQDMLSTLSLVPDKSAGTFLIEGPWFHHFPNLLPATLGLWPMVNWSHFWPSLALTLGQRLWWPGSWRSKQSEEYDAFLKVKHTSKKGGSMGYLKENEPGSLASPLICARLQRTLGGIEKKCLLLQEYGHCWPVNHSAVGDWGGWPSLATKVQWLRSRLGAVWSQGLLRYPVGPESLNLSCQTWPSTSITDSGVIDRSTVSVPLQSRHFFNPPKVRCSRRKSMGMPGNQFSFR